jgi:TonB family protein
MKAVFIFLFVCIRVIVFSQNIYVVKVCDLETKRPLRNVAITVDTLKTVSNFVGFFQINGDTSKLITAELAGYEKLSFRFPATDRFVFYLRKIESEQDREKAKSFYTYIGERIRYPSEARRSGIQGTSIIYFEVDTLGQVTKTETVKKVGFGCTEECLRALKKAPQVWYSIKQNTKFQLRVIFKIADSQFPTEHVESKAPEGVILLPEVVVTAYQKVSISPFRP